MRFALVTVNSLAGEDFHHWSAVNGELDRWNMKPYARQVIESELKLSLPSIQFFREQNKDEELKTFAMDLKRRASEAFVLRNEKEVLNPIKKYNLGDCVAHLNYLEDRYENMIHHYEELFKQMSNPLTNMREKVKLSLQEQKDFPTFQKIFELRNNGDENKSIEFFDIYFSMGEKIVLDLNLQLKEQFSQFQKQEKIKHLRLELTTTYRGQEKSSPFELCGEKSKEKFCIPIEGKTQIIFPERILTQTTVDRYLKQYGQECLAKLKGELVEKLAFSN